MNRDREKEKARGSVCVCVHWFNTDSNTQFCFEGERKSERRQIEGKTVP